MSEIPSGGWRRWISYDWFKLVVALLLLLLLLAFWLTLGRGRETGLRPTGTTAAVAGPTSTVESATTPAPTAVATRPAVGATLTQPAAGGLAGAGQISFAGTAEPNSEVEVMVDGASVGRAPVGADGQWGLNTRIDRAGDRAIVVRTLVNGAVVATSNPVTVTLLAVPTLTPPTGAVAGAPTMLSGTATPGSRVQVVVDGTVGEAVTVGADGRWSAAVPLTSGGHELIIRAIDRNGNRLTASAPTQITVGHAVAIVSPNTGAAVPGGDLVLSGTGAPGSDVEVLDGLTVVATVKVGADGTWRHTLRPIAGSHGFSVRPVGGAAAGPPVAVSVGLTAPQITEPAANAAVPAGDVTFGGVGEPNSEIELLAGSAVLAKLKVGADGRWQHVQAVTAGAYQYAVRPVDGSVSGAPLSVTVGPAAAAAPTAPPAPAAPATSAVGSITSPANGSTVPAGSVTLIGTGPAGGEVEILDYNTPIARAVVDASGGWQFIIIGPVLGTHSYSVRPTGSPTASAPISVLVSGVAAPVAPPAAADPCAGVRGIDRGDTWVVVSCDTLSGISAWTGVPIATILRANPEISNSHRIYAGQIIRLPGRARR